MIRVRQSVAVASGADPFTFGPLYKYRVQVVCPPGETVRVRPVDASGVKDSFLFGPGDSGWISLRRLHSGILVDKGSGSSSATVSIWWADEENDEVHPPGCCITGPVGSVLYDSGSVAAGAAIDSGALDLSFVNAVEVVIDNTAASVVRDLSMLSYLADGATLIDQNVIRRCAFGVAPTGAMHAPGRNRGLISPHPPGGTTGVHVIYDVTSAVNTANNTGRLFCEDGDAIEYMILTSAGTTTGYVDFYDDAGTQLAIGTIGALSYAMGGIVPGLSASVGWAASYQTLLSSLPVPRSFGIRCAAAGAGNTVRVLVQTRGRVPGTFSVPIALPPRARFQLAAAGAAAARMTIFAR